jgi:hypothetical protein
MRHDENNSGRLKRSWNADSWRTLAACAVLISGCNGPRTNGQVSAPAGAPLAAQTVPQSETTIVRVALPNGGTRIVTGYNDYTNAAT